jgi:tyrosine aminotransferase
MAPLPFEGSGLDGESIPVNVSVEKPVEHAGAGGGGIVLSCPSEPLPWSLSPSKKAKRTSNPVRNIVDNLKPPTHLVNKPIISLSLGDPTVYGNLPCPDVLVDAVVRSAREQTATGYAPSNGILSARAALAAAHSLDNAVLTPEVGDTALTYRCHGRSHVRNGSPTPPGHRHLQRRLGGPGDCHLGAAG